MSASAALRIPARELLAPDRARCLRERVEWKGIALIAHAWAVILGSIALVAVFPNPLTLPARRVLIGSRQLGLAILMHDGAHGCFSRNEARNMALSQWFCAYPVFADTRRLSALSPCPSRAHAAGRRPRSGALGALPDHQGELSPQVLARYHGPDRLRAAQGAAPQRARRSRMAVRQRRRHFGEKLGPQIAANAVLFAGARARPACGGPIRCSGSCRC